jgi:hypothetical protein
MTTLQLQTLEELKARCTPDPKKRCKHEGCYGERGWYGMKVDQDGTPQLLYCCGIDGKSEFSLIEAQVKEVAKALAEFREGYYEAVMGNLEALKALVESNTVLLAQEIAAARGQQTI